MSLYDGLDDKDDGTSKTDVGRYIHWKDIYCKNACMINVFLPVISGKRCNV